MENEQSAGEPLRKKRGRPPSGRKLASPSRQERPGLHGAQEGFADRDASRAKGFSSTRLAGLTDDEEQVTDALDNARFAPFTRLLSDILRHDRMEIARVARELDVTENTIYRWLNGNSVPRHNHLKRLPEVLIEHRGSLILTIRQVFPGVLDTVSVGVTEIGKDIYREVLEMVRTLAEEDTRFWQVSQLIFEHALEHLDLEKRGLSVTYAKLMPARADGVHSLREVSMRGSDPWPYASESKAYLGSTTLAGMAATFQRMQIWDSLESANRSQVEVDDFEASACAVPVMRGGRIAGVLIVSSAQPGFFNDSMACQTVEEYAQLLSLALPDQDFQPYGCLNLRPMPGLRWQREQILQSYVSRTLALAREQGLSRSGAEMKVQCDMELEFEKQGTLAGEMRRTTMEQVQSAMPRSGGSSSGQN